MRPRGILLGLALMLGCGSSGVRLTHDELERLPRDFRQEIFDAENDLVIARNRLDDASDRKVNAERAFAALASKWQQLDQHLSASKQTAYLPKAQKVFDANVAYARSLVDVAAAGVARAEADVPLTRSRLYLVRQRQLARIGRASVASLKPLEDTVKDLEAKLKAASGEEIDLRTRVQTLFSAWKAAEDDYVAASGDYDTGVWGD